MREKTPLVPSVIFHCEILEKICECGMGVVCKAHDTRLDRIVALNFLPGPLLFSPEENAPFEQESRAMCGTIRRSGKFTA